MNRCKVSSCTAHFPPEQPLMVKRGAESEALGTAKCQIMFMSSPSSWPLLFAACLEQFCLSSSFYHALDRKQGITRSAKFATTPCLSLEPNQYPVSVPYDASNMNSIVCSRLFLCVCVCTYLYYSDKKKITAHAHAGPNLKTPARPPPHPTHPFDAGERARI
jgi:hypothetical protein